MLKKFFMTLLWLVMLMLLAASCWATTVFADWPLWSAPLLFGCVILGIALTVFITRRWHIWRLRRRMQRDLPEKAEDSAPDVDKNWRYGLRLLRGSRLGRLGSALYALPWFMMLGDSSSGKTTLLTRSGLATPLRAVGRSDLVLPTDTLEWWFFERAVVIDPAGRLVAGSAGWKRLLYWLLRSRRREPLNGVMLVVEADRILSDDQQKLNELGRLLRRQLDDLVKVFGARIPVYLILTGGERLTGLTEWVGGLDADQREQAFGLLAHTRDKGAGPFLEEVLGKLNQRLSALRIEFGLHKLPDAKALHFPERVAELRAGLEHLLLPAFDSNPYSESPLLAGLFITAQGEDSQKSPQGWFSQELLDHVLPAQRYAYRPLESWRYWRRFMVHAAVVLWLVGCGATALVLLYADDHARRGLTLVAQRPSANINFSNGLDGDLEAFGRYRQFIRTLENYDQPAWKRWLPFHRHIDDVVQNERATYVAAFFDQIQRPLFAGVLADNVAAAAMTNDDRMIAAYAELLVRRINLIDARLAGKSMDEMPGPDEELVPLFQHVMAEQAPSASQAQSLSGSYKAYLTWQRDEETLRADRISAARQLDSLGLASRPLSWLVTWAEQQTQLPTLRYSDYMADADQPNGTLPRAFTVEGQQAILSFIDELVAATRNETIWKNQRERFLTQYQSDTQDAWYRFIQGYLLVDQQRMASQTEWREVLSAIATPRDPYRKLLRQAAQRFELIPNAQRTPWAGLSIRLDRLLIMADDADARDDNSLFERIRVANQLGSDALKGMTQSGSVTRGVSEVTDEKTQAKVLAEFEQKLRSVVVDLQKSDAQAYQVALDNWGFGSDPGIKSAGLWEARDLRDGVKRQLQNDDARSTVVWTLATGGLDFALAYAAEIAACRLQQDWNGQVLGAIEGVRDPVIASDLLYGDRGQVPQFLNGPVKAFIQRDAQGFRPRMALDQQIPLTSAFYAFISRTQRTQTEVASAKRQSALQQAAQLADKQTLEANQQSLQAQQAALQQQIPKLLAIPSVVDIQTIPPSINLGARQLPQQTRLTMQCSNRSTVLENYNFPTSTSFAWAPGSCSDVSLEIRFANYTLSKRWSGDQGFIDFLRAFKGGQRVMTRDDFPNQRELMGSDNVSSITLTYRQQGEESLLRSYEQAQALQQQSDALSKQLSAIADQLNVINTQARSAVANEPGQSGGADQRMLGVNPPSQIAWCWTAPPSERAGASAPTRVEVEAGVFDDSQRADHVRRQLKALGFASRVEQLTSNKLRVIVTDLSGPQAQRQAIERMDRYLSLQAKPMGAPFETDLE